MSAHNDMEEVSLEQLIARYNLIVPEIQREYVWGSNDFQILDTFINDVKEGYAVFVNNKNTPNPAFIELEKIYNISDELTKKSIKKLLDGLDTCNDSTDNASMNIGFLYSYRPDYYVFNDRNEDVYLIDGQQRFTTLFLTLYYFALKEQRQEEFERLFRFDKALERIAFDYRVRTLTHNFIIDLLTNTKTIEELLQITTKSWFLFNYKHDVTVQSIVGTHTSIDTTTGTFNILHKHFQNDSNHYFDFIKNQIKFWHFKTEETSQGEELYITMNSRGQQLADNETIRAKFFETEEVRNDQLYWSEKWEKWQDFFWKNRDKTDKEATADKGFNEFLRWIQIIKMVETQTVETDDSHADTAKNNEIVKFIRWEATGVRKINSNYLSLKDIDLYFQAVKYLYTDFKNHLIKVQKLYPDYADFNLLNTDWLCPKEDSIGQIDCFSFLPILFYCKKYAPYAEVDGQNLFRIVRFFHNLKKDITIAKTPAQSCINAIKLVNRLPSKDICAILTQKGVSSTLLNEEESNKLKMYNAFKDNELEEKLSEKREFLEAAFWRAEDMAINDGEITHLISLAYLQNKKEGVSFVKTFNSVLNTYEEIIEHEEDIWGNLLVTSVYNENISRVTFRENWHKNIDFLELVIKRRAFEGNLDDFLVNEQKEFIQTYNDKMSMQEEQDLKKQLYIYYIICKNILKRWDWYGRYNFGVYDRSDLGGIEAHTLFKTDKIFRYYSQNWVRKLNYFLDIHSPENAKRDSLKELINWANS